MEMDNDLHLAHYYHTHLTMSASTRASQSTNKQSNKPTKRKSEVAVVGEMKWNRREIDDKAVKKLMEILGQQ